MKVFSRLTVLFICAWFYSCKQTQQSSDTSLLEPQIRAGMAKLSGQILAPVPPQMSLNLRFQNPVTAHESIYEASPDSDGRFHFEVPVECSKVQVSLVAPGYGGTFVVLSPDEEAYVEVQIGSNGVSLVRTDQIRLLSSQD